MRLLAGLLGSRRYTAGSEVGLHVLLAGVLDRAGIPHEREVRLSARDRVDLLVVDVAVEVKVKGGDPTSQLARYAEHDRVAGLLLVTTRNHRLPPELNGKPADTVSLLTNGLR